MKTTRCAVVLCFLAVVFAGRALGQEARGNFPDLASTEINLSAETPPVGYPDFSPRAFGRPDGQLCALEIENFTLKARYSDDGGQTFGAEVLAAGGPEQPRVDGYDAVMTPGGVLHVALVVHDPEGGLALQHVRSNDMGRSWTEPVFLARSGAPGAAQGRPNIDANDAGVVAVVYENDSNIEFFAYAVVSADGGATWMSPRRAFAVANHYPAVTVHPTTNHVHVVAGASTSRSTNLGASFEPAIDLGSSLPPGSITPQYSSRIGTASDGSVVIAVGYRDASYQDFVRVFRSTDNGASYVTTLDQLLQGFSGDYSRRDLQLVATPDTSTVLLMYVDRFASPGGTHNLVVQRSGDNGASFGSPQVLSGDARTRVPLNSLVARTSAGNWGIVWDSWGPVTRNVFVRTSVDDALSWGPQQQVNEASPNGASPPDVAAVGLDDLFVVFGSRRDSGLGVSDDIFAGRSTASAPSFGTDMRVDIDGGVAPDNMRDLIMTTAGTDRVHVAYCTDREIYVSSSADRGRTFSSPLLVASGDGEVWTGAIGATPAGHVYLAYTVGPNVRFTRSLDGGASWEGDRLLGAGGQPWGIGEGGVVDMAVTPDGKVYVTWDHDQEIFVARSLDFGVSFDIRDVDQNTGFGDSFPIVCAQGNQVILAWQEEGEYIVRGTASSNGGDTYSAPVTIGSDLYYDGMHDIACDGHGGAVVVWASWDPAVVIGASHFDGASWTFAPMASPPLVDFATRPQVTYVDADGTTAIVVYDGWTAGERYPQVYAVRSTDGGASFTSYQRLDAEGNVPVPEAYTWLPRVAADGLGNVWVSFSDDGAGANQTMVVARSTDGGLTFEAPFPRANSDQPQGGFFNITYNVYFFGSNDQIAALPGKGLFAWLGERQSTNWSALFNADAVDDADHDGFASDVDCNDTEPDVYPGAPEICDGRNNDCNDESWPDLPAIETADPDGDGVACADNCPAVANPDQTDSDDDGLGDACDALPAVGVRELASDEIILNESLPLAGNPDFYPEVFGLRDGRVCVLMEEAFRLRSLYSGNRGQTFEPEVDVAGTGGRRVFGFHGELSSDGRLYVALVMDDPAGGHSVEFVRSDDMGRTWTAPRRLLAFVDDGVGFYTEFYSVRVAAASGGRIAVAVSGDNVDGARLVASADGGTTWTSPAVIEDVSVSGFSFGTPADVAIDAASGEIYTVVDEYGPDGYVRPAIRRSSDGGSTFGPAVVPSSLAGLGADSCWSRIVVGGDGSVVVAAGIDSWNEDQSQIRVFRSVDGGATFSETLRESYEGDGYYLSARVAVAPDASSVLVAYVDTDNVLRVARSGDRGASFASSVPLTGSDVNRAISVIASGNMIARTSEGTWAIGWSDTRQTGTGPGSYVTVSADEGVTWAPARRASDLVGSGGLTTGYPALAGTGLDEIVVVFPDRRRSTSGNDDVYVNRSAAATLSFGPDRRIDTDFGESRPYGAYPMLATDGEGRVYASFASRDAGSGYDVRIARSDDGGRSFGPAVRVSGWAPGSLWNLPGRPVIAADADGTVYAAYIAQPTPDPGSAQVLVNVSHDHGVTWGAAETVLAVPGFPNSSWLDIESSAGGFATVAWTDGNAPFVARTSNAGSTWTVVALQSGATAARFMRVCEGGGRYVAAWRAQYSGSAATTWASASVDGGATWTPPVRLDPDDRFVSYVDVDCHPSGAALAAWGGGWGASTSRLPATGGSWLGPVDLESGGPFSQPAVAWTGATAGPVAVALWDRYNLRMWSYASSDGGATFGDATPVNIAAGASLRATGLIGMDSDLQGNVWVGWEENGLLGTGKDDPVNSILVARSTDGGATFQAPRRFDRTDPPAELDNIAASVSFYRQPPRNILALPGVGLVAWAGSRDSENWIPLLNADALDDADRDGFTSETDCDDNDPDVYPEAPEICDGKNNDCTDESWPFKPPSEYDLDEDGLAACRDNCPFDPNPSQRDGDGDGLGDACDAARALSIIPGDGAVGTPVSASITVAFSEPIDASTLNDGSVYLAPFGPVADGVAATRTLDTTGTVLTFDPVAELQPETDYAFDVTSNLLGTDGDPVEAFTATFVTGAAPAESAPLPDVSEETTGVDAGSFTGSSTSRAGDLNADGYDDVLAGAPEYSASATRATLPESGAAAVYFGSADEAERASPDIIFTGVAAHDRAGVSVAGGFDWNGDGVPDLVIGAEQVDRTVVDPAGSPTGPGKVYVVYFDPTDLVHYPNIGDPNVADSVALGLVGQPGGIPGVVLEGESLGDQAGFSVAFGGRVGPAGPDLAIGAPGIDRDEVVDNGRVYLLYNDPSLTGTIPLTRVVSGASDQLFGRVFLGGPESQSLGWSVAFVGDVSGDGFEDLAMGAPYADPIPPGGLATIPTRDAGTVDISTTQDPDDDIIEVDGIGGGELGIKVIGTQEGENLGYTVASGGDNLGNGEPDVLAGAPNYDSEAGEDSGRVVQTSGTTDEGVYTADDVGATSLVGTPLPGVIWTGEAAGDRLGFAVAGLGDLNGDGLDDIALGAPLTDPIDPSGDPIPDAGTVYVVYGRIPDTFALGSVSVVAVGETIAGQAVSGTQPGENAGASLAGVGDVNGDGLSDAAVGAPGRDDEPGDDTGTVYLILEASEGFLGDADRDGILDPFDNCVNAVNPLQEDADVDGVGDPCDNCPFIPNPGQEDSNGNGVGDACEVAGNQAPVANAGPDQTVECTGNLRATVALDGSGSYDPNGLSDIASYAWSEDGTTLASTVIADVPFSLNDPSTVTLTVTDRGGLSDTDDALILVKDDLPPTVSIASPTEGLCSGDAVSIVATRTDVCDPDPALTYDPPGGPTYGAHGTHVVTVTATDASGNTHSDTVTFTVDLIPPTATIVQPAAGTLIVPSSLPLAMILTSGDDDEAAGAVVRERLYLDGCPALDGATYGDGDGLLTDEALMIDKGWLCPIADACGFTELIAPTIRFEAEDCGGNVAADEVTIRASIQLRPGVCGVAAKTRATTERGRIDSERRTGATTIGPRR